MFSWLLRHSLVVENAVLKEKLAAADAANVDLSQRLAKLAGQRDRLVDARLAKQGEIVSPVMGYKPPAPVSPEHLVMRAFGTQEIDSTKPAS